MNIHSKYFFLQLPHAPESCGAQEDIGGNMEYLDRSAQPTGISRRKFVATGAAALATVGLVSCSSGTETSEGESEDKAEDAGQEGAEADGGEAAPIDSMERDLVSGEWISAACWHNCGGRCVNKVLVQDGVVIRQKTDDRPDEGFEDMQQRSCVRGHSQRMQAFGAGRLKYPMKRKTWSPDAPNGDMRGKDEWERLTWDEAIAYVGDELKKVYEKYGPQGVLGCGSKGVMTLLNAMGGYCSVTDSTSLGTYGVATAQLGLPEWDYIGTINDRYDMVNADLIVLHAANPAWSGPGFSTYCYLQAKRAGVPFVVIGPDNNASAQMFNARWIRVRTGTDLAFMMGVAYEMLKLDEAQGNVVDWDFLHTYCVGFDDENMPEGAEEGQNIYHYLLGDVDGTPKTAEWASQICGTPVEDIRWYAEAIGKEHKVMLHHGAAFARVHNAEDIPQMFLTLGCMGGHFGKSGHACGMSIAQPQGNGGATLVSAGAGGITGAAGTIYEPIPAPKLWESILAGSYRYIGTQYGALDAGEDRPLDIHVVAFEAAATLQTTPNIMKGIEALRTMDFVFTSAYSLNTQAKYSDIVLPCTTEWERPGGGFPVANRETLIVYRQVVQPLYEAKTDAEIGMALADYLGLDTAAIWDRSDEQVFMDQILGATVMNEAGEYVPLVTVTDQDLADWGVEGAAQEGQIALKEFLDNGCYHVKRSEGDAFGFIAYEAFVNDPENNPLGSPSGKFELYCQAKADEYNGTGAGDPVMAYPTYNSNPVCGWETTFSDWDSQTKGDYPYNLYNPHYLRRSHSVLDDNIWLRETWRNPVFLNAQDAAEKGIVSGDAVCVYNQYGKVVRTASVLQTLMPGMVALPHGSWVDMDEAEEFDLGGADNVLCGSTMSTSGISSYNNYNCNFEKYTGGELVPDCEKPERIIEL